LLFPILKVIVQQDNNQLNAFGRVPLGRVFRCIFWLLHTTKGCRFNRSRSFGYEKGGALCFRSQKNEVVEGIIPEKRLRVLDKVKLIAVVQGYVATNVFRLLVLKVRAFFF
jgi:hypothetical protein